jgi:hypothetical protein
MYQERARGLLTVMSTLHRFAEAAVRRDLSRARVVLASGIRLSPERRCALSDHLAWMSGMIESADERTCDAAYAVFTAACGFWEYGDRAHRIELLTAVTGLLRATEHTEGWTSRDAVRSLGEYVPWLLDGVAVPIGAGLQVRQAGGADERRMRAAAYRQAKAQLWGPVGLTARPPGLEAAVPA